ncbi:MAG: mcbE [Pseudomonas sp.]|nr:mcbE [Pseudomonas sp.]
MSNVIIAFKMFATLITIFIKDQLQVPFVFFWIIISSVGLFYGLAFLSASAIVPQQSCIDAAPWLYAYTASSAALFGFTLCLIGRRDSGFIQSVVDKKYSRHLFLSTHYLAHSLLSLFYCSLFYVISRLPFGAYDAVEHGDLLVRFYTCFMLFCIPGLLFSLLPINFQTASTTLSIFSFCMLVFGAMSASRPEITPTVLNALNPVLLAHELMLEGVTANWKVAVSTTVALTLTFGIVLRFFRIHPICYRN